MTTYIIPIPAPTSPDDLAQGAFDYLASVRPGWVANDGVEGWLIYSWAFMVATLSDLSQTVMASIFRFWGASILAQHLPYLAPIDGAAATLTSLWTAVDTAGYTIPAGTLVGFQVAGDTLVGFTVDIDTVIAPGNSTVDGVPLTAMDLGTAGNGLTASIVLIDDLAWVTSVTADAAPAGGVDPETDDAYLTRLAQEMTLLAPSVVLAADAGLYVLNVPGIAKAMGIDNYSPGRVFTDGSMSSTSSPNLASPALAQFTNDDVGRAVTGTGVAASTTIASVTSPTLAVMSHNATSTGSGRTITLGDLSNIPRALTVAVADVDGEPCTSPEKVAAVALLQAAREPNFLMAVIDPTYTTVNVAFTGKSLPGYDPDTVSAAAVDAVTAYLSPASWGGTGAWPNEVRLLDIAGVLAAVPGFTFAAGGSVTLNSSAADLSLTGIAPLPTLGTVTPLVTAS